MCVAEQLRSGGVFIFERRGCIKFLIRDENGNPALPRDLESVPFDKPRRILFTLDLNPARNNDDNRHSTPPTIMEVGEGAATKKQKRAPRACDVSATDCHPPASPPHHASLVCMLSSTIHTPTPRAALPQSQDPLLWR